MSRTIKGITIQIGAETSGLDKALQDVNKRSRDIGKELQKVNTLLRFNPKDTELIAQKQKILGEQVEITKEKLDKLKAAEKEVQEQFKKGDITEEQYRAFQREIVETESKLKHYGSQLKDITDKHVVLADKMTEVGDKLKEVGKKVSDTGKNLSLKLTTPLVGLGTVASKLGIDFEKSMSNVQAVTGATAEEMEQLEKAARDAGSTTDKSARDAADALQYMGLAGWSVTDSQEALMPMLKLSSAANMDLGRTSDLVTDTMSALGLEIDDLDGYLDVLAQTSRKSNTDVDQLGEGFLTVGGRLRDLGVDLEEGAAALGILANNGIKGTSAGRGLNAILTNLTAPTGRAKEAMEELGISVFDSNGEFIGIEESLKLVEGSMVGMTSEQKNMYNSMIAGKEHSKTLGALMNGLGGDFEALKGDITGADGALEDMYVTATDNTMGAINNLKSAMEELGLKIFDSLQPHIEKLVDWVQKITDKFNALSPKQQENIVKIGMLVAAIGPALLIIGKLITVVGTIIGVFAKLIPIVKQAGVVIGFLTSPIGLAIAAVVAMVAIGVSLWKNWDTIKEKAGQLGTYVSEKFEAIKEGIMTPINAAKDGVYNAIEAIKGFFKFEWSLPPLKLPHISMTGKFGLMPPSVPKFGIEWRKDGAIFNKPYVFGNQGWGEAGPEAVLPIEKLGSIMADIMNRLGYNNTTNSINTNNNKEIVQNIVINSPKGLTPSETARQVKNASRNLAMEW